MRPTAVGYPYWLTGNLPVDVLDHTGDSQPERLEGPDDCQTYQPPAIAYSTVVSPSSFLQSAMSASFN